MFTRKNVIELLERFESAQGAVAMVAVRLGAGIDIDPYGQSDEWCERMVENLLDIATQEQLNQIGSVLMEGYNHDEAE